MGILKKCSLGLLCAIMSLSLTGCDFLRTIAGRPTSEELAVIEKAAQEKLVREQVVKDSLAVVAAREAAEREAEAFWSSKDAPRIVDASTLKGLAFRDVEFKYLIVLGSFSKPENVVSFTKRLSEAGYEPVVLKYNYGTQIVCVCPSADKSSLMQACAKVSKEPFCPGNYWIIAK